MLKKEQIVSIVKKNGGYESKAETERKIKEAETMVDGVLEALPVGEKVKFLGVTFEKKLVEAHEARNPKTGETVKVAEKIKTTAKLK